MVLKAYIGTLATATLVFLTLACAKTQTEIELSLHQNSKQWQQGFRYFLHGPDTLHLLKISEDQYPVFRSQNSSFRGERIVKDYAAERRNFRVVLDIASKWSEDLSDGKEDELLLTFRYLNFEQTVQYALIGGIIDTARHTPQNLRIRGQNVNNVFVEATGNHVLLIVNGGGIIGFVTPQNDTILGFNP